MIIVILNCYFLKDLKYYRYKLVDKTSHILITGTVNSNAALDFFKEYFHEDHGEQPRQIVIL